MSLPLATFGLALLLGPAVLVRLLSRLLDSPRLFGPPALLVGMPRGFLPLLLESRLPRPVPLFLVAPRLLETLQTLFVF